MYDVARTAGVGVGTVSRVINNGDAVRPQTARLVREAMASLGYQPPPPDKRRGPRRRDRQGQNGSAGASSIVVLILGQQGLRWILDCAPIFSYVLHGIESALSETGHNLLIRQAADWQAVDQVARQGGCSGIILFGAEPSGPPLPTFLPAVWVMGSPKQFSGDRIQPDHMQAGIMAANCALSHGHRHCALLGTGLGSPDASFLYRNDAFTWVIEQAGGKVEQLIDPQGMTITSQENSPNEPVVAALIDRLAAMNPRPTALFLQADVFAPSVYRLLLERGIRPQQDITIITCNNERPYLMGLRPQPVIVDLQAEFIGRRAVDQLYWRMKNPIAPGMRVMIEPLLVDSRKSETAV